MAGAPERPRQGAGEIESINMGKWPVRRESHIDCPARQAQVSFEVTQLGLSTVQVLEYR